MAAGAAGGGRRKAEADRSSISGGIPQMKLMSPCHRQEMEKATVVATRTRRQGRGDCSRRRRRSSSSSASGRLTPPTHHMLQTAPP